MSKHDPLCPDHPHSEVFFPVHCECALIAKVRVDERHKVMAEGPYFTSVVHDCCVELQELRAAVVEMLPVRGES